MLLIVSIMAVALDMTFSTIPVIKSRAEAKALVTPPHRSAKKSLIGSQLSITNLAAAISQPIGPISATMAAFTGPGSLLNRSITAWPNSITAAFTSSHQITNAAIAAIRSPIPTIIRPIGFMVITKLTIVIMATRALSASIKLATITTILPTFFASSIKAPVFWVRFLTNSVARSSIKPLFCLAHSLTRWATFVTSPNSSFTAGANALPISAAASEILSIMVDHTPLVVLLAISMPLKNLPPLEVIFSKAAVNCCVVTLPALIILKKDSLTSVPITSARSWKIGTPASAIILSDSISTLPLSIALVKPRVIESSFCALPPAVSPSIRIVLIVFSMSPFITGNSCFAVSARFSNWKGVVADVLLRASTNSLARLAPPSNGVKAASASSILENSRTKKVTAPVAAVKPAAPNLIAAPPTRFIPATVLSTARLTRRRPRSIPRVNLPIRFCIRETGAVIRSTALKTASTLKRPAILYPFGFVCSFSSRLTPS